MSSVEATELLGTAEVAAVLGVQAKTVGAYLARGQMPAPDVRLACGPIWYAATVERWRKKRAARLTKDEKRLAELERKHERVIGAIIGANEVAGARQLQAGRNLRARKHGGAFKQPTVTQQRASYAMLKLDEVLETRGDDPTIRRLRDEMDEANRLRERLDAATRERGLAF